MLKKQNERLKKRIQRKDNSKKEKNLLIKKKDLKCLVEMRINIISKLIETKGKKNKQLITKLTSSNDLKNKYLISSTTKSLKKIHRKTLTKYSMAHPISKFYRKKRNLIRTKMIYNKVNEF